MNGFHWVYKIIGDLGKSEIRGVAQPTAVGSGVNEKERKGGNRN